MAGGASIARLADGLQAPRIVCEDLDKRDLRRSMWSVAILKGYRLRRLQGACVSLSWKLEGGDFYSATLRDILEKYHGVRAGAYSYGEGLVPGAFPAGVTIGRYVSIASGVRVFLRNHPLDRLSLHPFFFNSQLGWIKKDSLAFGTLEIGHDAWIGANALITTGCKSIGIGAVVAAGAVVTKNVPDFAIVAGNPARLLRYRFTESAIATILASRWWEKSAAECAKFMPEMNKPVGDTPSMHPLLANRNSPAADS